MLYNQPYGITDTNASYINGDPSVGRAGSIPPAASIEYPQREIVNFITDCNLTPTNADLDQLAKSVQTGAVVFGADSGSVNNVSIALVPPLVAYVDGMTFRVRAANTNTGPATFNAGPGAINIVRRGGGALQPGDMPAGSISMLNYNRINNNVELYGVNFQSQTLVPIMDREELDLNRRSLGSRSTMLLCGWKWGGFIRSRLRDGQRSQLLPLRGVWLRSFPGN
jgi:hypothetical protein